MWFAYKDLVFYVITHLPTELTVTFHVHPIPGWERLSESWELPRQLMPRAQGPEPFFSRAALPLATLWLSNAKQRSSVVTSRSARSGRGVYGSTQSHNTQKKEEDSEPCSKSFLALFGSGCHKLSVHRES